MSESLYERDILAWSRQQATALKRRGAGSNLLDYDNLAEEIKDVGLSILHACESQVDNIVTYLWKIEYVRSPDTVPHWKGEIVGFRQELERRLTPSIRRKLRTRWERRLEASLRRLTTAELISPEQAADARRRGRTLEQVVDPDWYPEPRYD